MEPAGHEANGFGRRYLREWEARALYEAQYMTPPDFRCPNTWIPIPPVPHGAARKAAIHRHYWEVLTPEERNDPLWDPNNEDQWTAFFTEQTKSWCTTTAMALRRPIRTPPGGRWGVPSRTLAFIFDHIAAGNYLL
jgi:hypothetical protein